MRHTPFPRSGEPVSKLGFGAMGFAGWFGSPPGPETARQAGLA